MTNQEILHKIENIKNKSRRTQASLAQKLKELENTGWCIENKVEMAKICLLHIKDISESFDKIYKLEKKLNLL